MSFARRSLAFAALASLLVAAPAVGAQQHVAFRTFTLYGCATLRELCLTATVGPELVTDSFNTIPLAQPMLALTHSYGIAAISASCPDPLGCGIWEGGDPTLGLVGNDGRAVWFKFFDPGTPGLLPIDWEPISGLFFIGPCCDPQGQAHPDRAELVNLVPVPEPASLALVGTGLFGVGFLARRRRR